MYTAEQFPDSSEVGLLQEVQLLRPCRCHGNLVNSSPTAATTSPPAAITSPVAKLGNACGGDSGSGKNLCAGKLLRPGCGELAV